MIPVLGEAETVGFSGGLMSSQTTLIEEPRDQWKTPSQKISWMIEEDTHTEKKDIP